MACKHPLLAVDYGIDPITKKHRIKILPERADFNLETLKDRYGDMLLQLPCGHCLACSENYRRSWAVRILLEASLYEDNSFITLTYDNNCLPKDNRPHRSEIVRFFKRLRKELDVPIRYFYCGEKGDKNPTGDPTGGRAHYHAIIFGFSFPDKVFDHVDRSGSQLFKSKLLNKCWHFGQAFVGDVEPGSAMYVAAYSTKKKLQGFNDGSFVGMSRRPGLGSSCFDLKWFKSDTIYCALGEPTIPRFFHKILEGLKPDYYEEWKKNRKERCSQRVGHQYYYGFRNEEEALFYEDDVRMTNYLRRMSRGY